ncbi:MAG: CAP domain-containing protein [Bacteroidia bacterium]|nr:CAP domain-containing protein [Bacteroidia bacterium]
MRNLILLNLCIFLFLFSGLSQNSGIFPDSAYSKYTWQTFVKIPQLQDTLNWRKVDYSLLNAAVFFLTNKAREENRRSLLLFSPALRNVADFHSTQMAKYEFVDHYNRINAAYSTPEKRGRKFNTSVIAENVASSFLYNYKSGSPFYRASNGASYDFFTNDNEPILPHTYLDFARQIVNDWMTSKGHRSNILHPGLRTLGCAIRVGENDMSEGMIPMGYGTQNFGL